MPTTSVCTKNCWNVVETDPPPKIRPSRHPLYLHRALTQGHCGGVWRLGYGAGCLPEAVPARAGAASQRHGGGRMHQGGRMSDGSCTCQIQGSCGGV